MIVVYFSIKLKIGSWSLPNALQLLADIQSLVLYHTTPLLNMDFLNAHHKYHLFIFTELFDNGNVTSGTLKTGRIWTWIFRLILYVQFFHFLFRDDVSITTVLKMNYILFEISSWHPVLSILCLYLWDMCFGRDILFCLFLTSRRA